MKNFLLGLAFVLSLTAIGIGASYAFGWIGVHQMKTIGKAKKNADREVYEETNSFVKAKRQEILKAYKEWQLSDNVNDKEAIANVLAMSLADFDEDRFINDRNLLNWVKQIKY